MYKIIPGLITTIVSIVLAMFSSIFFFSVLRASDPHWPLLIPLIICTFPLLFIGKRFEFFARAASAVLLLAFATTTVASIGLFYLPSTLLMIIAAAQLKFTRQDRQ